MTYAPPPLIAPPKEEEVHPYRRVWRSLTQETAILAIVCTAVFILFQYLPIRIPAIAEPILNYGLALLPLALWIILARFPETRVPLPRTGLNTTVVLSALLAAAVGIPVVNTVIQPANWLSVESAPVRVIGYMLTAGIVQEFIKFLVVRFVAGGRFFRIREDSVAFNMAAAVGYITVLNLAYVVNNAASPDFVALRVLHHVAMNTAGSLIISYGFAQTWFANVSPFMLPFTLVIASFVNGLIIPLRSGFMNASLGISGASAQPLFGLGFSLGVLLAAVAIISFFYRVAAEQERIARQTRGNL